MKLVNFQNPVTNDWLVKEGHRLDAPPFLSGAVEAKIALAKIDVPTQKLSEVTAGYGGGIYNGPQFKRNYVTSPEHGIPFMTASSILLADMSQLPLLSKKDALSKKLAYLRIEEGMTLISCSGSIGRMAYARPEMAGVWSSQDVLKVVPNPEIIPPGYLYAYLSSKYGKVFVTSGTYGAVIQHLEPQHIADLPVPRLGAELEREIDTRIKQFAELITESNSIIEKATKRLMSNFEFGNLDAEAWLADRSDMGFSVGSNRMVSSMRAWNQSSRADAIKKAIREKEYSDLGEVLDENWLKWRVMFKRIDADKEHGIEVMTQKPLFQLMPSGRWVSRKYMLDLSPRFMIPDETILIAKQGTLGEEEAFCRTRFIYGNRDTQRAYSDHCMRLVVKENAIDPGYLFAFLRSEVGFRLLRALAEGAKQQDIHWRTIPNLPIPRLPREQEKAIGDLIREAFTKKNRAIDLHEEAAAMLEASIESHSRG